MLSPLCLEIMVEGIQIERRREAEVGRLAKIRKSTRRFQEQAGRLLMTLGGKEKEEALSFSSATSSPKA